MRLNSDESIVNVIRSVLSPVVLMSKALPLRKTLHVVKPCYQTRSGNLYGLLKGYTRIKKASPKGTLYV